MKTLPVLSALTALVAFVLIQFSFVTAVSLLFTAGVVALTVADYRRAVRPLALPASAVLHRVRRRERFGLAA